MSALKIDEILGECLTSFGGSSLAEASAEASGLPVSKVAALLKDKPKPTDADIDTSQ